MQVLQEEVSKMEGRPGVRGFEIVPGFEGLATLPERSTKYSAGYDICAAGSYKIKPGQLVPIDTGITAYMLDDEMLSLHVRSGLSKVHRLKLANGTGIVDCDFYSRPIKLLLENKGTEVFLIKPGDRLAQGVFQKFLLADDDECETERQGGLGSTGLDASRIPVEVGCKDGICAL